VQEGGQKTKVLKKETKAWRDKKVKLKHIEIGDLVLLQNPCTETTGKLEPKWTRPFVVMEKQGQEFFVWQKMKEGC
jgi:hypothetical protein